MNREACATIAICNQKGGVAKTTTCLSLGAALAEMGHSVLLIDLDPQANLTLSLGLKPEKLRRSVMDALLEKSSLLGVSRETDLFALDIAPATYELALVDKVFYQRLLAFIFVQISGECHVQLNHGWIEIDNPLEI